jgi:hypothetical protein
MKKLIIVAMAVISFNAVSATRCEPTPTGGMCCWDTTKTVFRPLGC